MSQNLKVAVVMGSDSDLSVVSKAIDRLKSFGVTVKAHIISAHRTRKGGRFAKSAEENGFGVIIAAAGKAAHLAGVLAAHHPAGDRDTDKIVRSRRA